MNSADDISGLIAAWEDAAAGKFAECADQASEHSRRFLQWSVVYGLWRLCSIRSHKISGETVSTSLLTYWTLRLQELKYHPDKVDETRAIYLAVTTNLLKSGQPLLADELRRQWTLATGETSAAPASQPPTVPVDARPRRIQDQRTGHLRSSGSSCEDGHWIDSVMDDGSIVKLEDGSIWQVDDVDAVDSALWLPTTDIVVCDGKLINTEDHESVSAEQIR